MAGGSLWQAEEVLRAVRGQCLHEQNWAACGVSIDSRTVKKGDLFVAIKGPAHDGHDHIAPAFAGGAVAALVSRRGAQVPPEMPTIFVDDTADALRQLAIAARMRATGKIVAVTGSVGKTSTKEMLRLALGAAGEAFASYGNLNNHYGAPLSLAHLLPHVNYGVFELGMNHAGELRELTKLARPHIAIITAIEAVHLEYFSSTEAIADAKSEIFEGVVEGGSAVLNINSQHYARLYAAAKAQGIKEVLSFGRDSKADARMVNCTTTAEGSGIHATIMGREVRYKLSAPGIHLAQNSLAALLTTAMLGADVDACAAALAHYMPPKGRGVRQEIARADGSFILIDESYNASPASVRATLKVLAQQMPGRGGKRIFVLGDMAELGPAAVRMHADLAEALSEAGIGRFYGCGEMSGYLFNSLPASMRGAHVSDSKTLAHILTREIGAGDVICIKGSNSARMNVVVDALKACDSAIPRKIAS